MDRPFKRLEINWRNCCNQESSAIRLWKAEEH